VGRDLLSVDRIRASGNRQVVILTAWIYIVLYSGFPAAHDRSDPVVRRGLSIQGKSLLTNRRWGGFPGEMHSPARCTRVLGKLSSHSLMRIASERTTHDKGTPG
jgi:hypothetical protein